MSSGLRIARVTRRSLDTALLALAALVVILSHVPLAPRFPGSDLDSAWVSALHESAIHRMAWGREIVFTFGPLGYLHTKAYWPGTYPWVLLYWAGIAAFTLGTVMSLGRLRGRSVAGSAAFMTVYALIASPVTDASLLGLLTLMVVRLFAGGAEGGRGYPAVAGVVLAILALTKGTFLLAAPTLLALYALDQALGSRLDRIAVAASAFLIAVLGLWVAAGQSPRDLWSFVRVSVALAMAYGDAMALDGPAREVFLYLGTSAVLLVGLVGWVRSAPRASTIGPVALAFVLFVAFKQGFIRHDTHTIIATRLLLATVTVVAFASQGSGRLVRGAYVIAALGALATVVTIDGNHVPGGLSEIAARQLKMLSASAAAAANPFRALREYRDQHARMAEFVAGEAGFGDVQGPADILSYRQQFLFHSGVSWRPRPVFQSYVAFTPNLLRLNAAAYLGPTAPLHVLLNVEPIDNRLPALDDSLLWPILLTRYDVVGGRGLHLLLRRARTPREYGLRPIGGGKARLGEEIVLPDTASGLVWATIDVETTSLGRLVSAAYKLPLLRLEVTTASGRRRGYRLIRGPATAGFLLSPVVADLSGFVALASDNAHPTATRIRSIRVQSASGGRWLYRRTVDYRFWELSFPPQTMESWMQMVAPTLFESVGALGSDWSLDSQYAIRTMDGPDHTTVTLFHAPSRIAFKPARPLRQLELGFGIQDAAWQNGQTDGVEFRVSVEDARLEGVLWSRLVRPRTEPKDRGVLTVLVEIPERWQGHRLVLETLPGPSGDAGWDWSFWSRITLIE